MTATDLSAQHPPLAPDAAAEPAEIDDARLLLLVESLLFVASEPAAAARMAAALGVSEERVLGALAQLETQLQGRGMRLQRHRGAAQLVSAPEAAAAIEAFLNLDLTSKLSRPALEALSIIAYRQPVTRPQIEAIRGVNSDGVLRTLLSRGLVEEVGRLEQAGRPILYGTTFAFLQYFGIEHLEDLPPLEEDVAEALVSLDDGR